MLRLVPGLSRAPDVSFIARGRLKRYKRGGERYPSIGPDLAVEVISKSNTKAEIARKMDEYFAAGTRLAWVVDPKTETVRVHRRAAGIRRPAGRRCPRRRRRAPGLPDPGAGPLRPGGRLSSGPAVLASSQLSHGPTDALPADDRPPQAARLGPRLRALAGEGIYFGTSSWKYEGWLGSIYSPGRYYRPGQVLASGSSRPNAWPSTPRPSPSSAATSASTSSPAPTTGEGSSEACPGRSSSPSRCPRRSPSRPGRVMPGTGPGPDRPTGRSSMPGCSSASSPARWSRTRTGSPTLIFEFGTIPRSVFAHRGRVRRTARPPSSGPCRAGFAMRSRSATPSISARATSPCWPATASRTCSTPGRGCRTSPPRPRCPGPSRPISRSSARCSGPGGPTSRPSPASRRIAAVGEPDPPTRDALVQIADRARQSGQAGLCVRQQPARGQCPVDHRSRGRCPRTAAGEHNASPPAPIPGSSRVQTPLPRAGCGSYDTFDSPPHAALARAPRARAEGRLFARESGKSLAMRHRVGIVENFTACLLA